MAENGGSGRGGGFLLGMVIGGLVGFAAGIFLAPRSGEETRALLSERGKEWRDKAEELAAATRERVSSATFEGRRAASRIRGENLFDDFDIDGEEM